MNSPENRDKARGRRAGRILGAVVGIAMFGILMSVRSVVEGRWLRSLIAGLAAAVLVLSFLPILRRRG